jgi:hypothetical protein
MHTANPEKNRGYVKKSNEKKKSPLGEEGFEEICRKYKNFQN